MKRDAVDFTAHGNPQPLYAIPPSEALAQRAHANWLSSLRNNGNRPGAAHQDAGWQLLRAMVDQLYGVRVGRLAYAVPCGGGKTQAVVALLAAMFTLRVFSCKTVLVVAQQVNALCDIKHSLIAAGVPDQAVGIVHSKANVIYPSTGNEKHPIMLVTHARIQHDGSLPECCRNRHGELHDLVIWDEALISTEAVCLGLASTRTALGHFAPKCPTVAVAYGRLRAASEEEQAKQDARKLACEMPPLLREQEADLAEAELRAAGYLDTTEQTLRDQALIGIGLLRYPLGLVDPRNGQSAGLMRYVVKVPDELSNIVILDASHAIDELRQADRTIRSGTSEAMTSFKNFSSVKAINYAIPSGRATIRDDRKALDQAVRIAEDLPAKEPVLFVTFKDWHERQLAQVLRSAGVPVDRKMPDGKPWLRIITWGSHTSDNSHTHCTHVVLVGLLRLPLLVTAAQLAAQKRDLTHRLDKTGLLGLERSVVAGNVMQAMNRGCMRLTDADGMAHPMTVHILAKDDLQRLLSSAMPGLRWECATVKEPTRTEDAAREITDYVLGLPADTTSVSKQAILSATGIKLAPALKAEAMAAAMTTLREHAYQRQAPPWFLEGRSLKRRVA